MKHFCVWVLEVAVLHATENRIAYWEIWEAFNTKAEAIAAKKKSETGNFGTLIKECQRIRKYVPAPEIVQRQESGRSR